MRQLRIILRREFIERVRSRSFLLSTILTPVFMSIVAVGPALSERLQTGGSYHFAVVDESETVGPRVVALLNSVADGDGTRISAEGGLGPAAGMRDELTDRVTRGRLDGYVWIPREIASGNHAELQVESGVPGLVRGRVAGAVSSAVQFSRLRAAGVPESEVAALFQPVDVAVRVMAQEPGVEGTGEGGLILSFLVGFLLYFLILLYGAQVMHSVQEEKTNRIAEVLVASVHPAELMLGKVLGVGAAALTQVAIWVLFARVVLGADALFARLGLPGDALAPFVGGIDRVVVLSALAYLVLGFFLYATVFAAVGAAAASMEDAQRFTFPIIVPLFIPMFLAEAIVNAPRGTTAVVLSWVPFTAPLVVPMRIGAGGATGLEIAATLGMLTVSVVVAGWVAGKIYRVGILSMGTRPSLRDLARWVRMA